MKKFFVLAALGACILALACESKSFATVRVYNEDGLPLAFQGSYKSNLVPQTSVDTFAPQDYQIEVDPDGDYVEASFAKSDVTDWTHLLTVELSYQGEVRAKASDSVP